MSRQQQIAWVRKTMTTILGRGARLHTYSVAELRAKVRETLGSSYWAGFQFPKELYDFAG
jgi:hypothetical protein